MALVALLSRGWAARSRGHNPKTRPAQAAWEVLRRWELGGESEVAELAAHSGLSTTALLCSLLRDTLPPQPVAFRSPPRGPPNNPRPPTCHRRDSHASGKRAEAGPDACQRACAPGRRTRTVVRASEASHPGPPNSSGELASRLAQQRARAMEALNGCGLAAGNATPLARQADVETVSARSVLSPLSRLHPGLPEQCGEHSAFPHRPGDTAPTMMEPATPGYTPVDLPAPLSWQTMGPPVADPGPSGHSWLYVPLLHAAAGQLDATAAADWRAHPHVGPQWHALVCALGEAPPVAPAALIRQIERLAHADGLMHA
ncbi:unnamed protein product, partial [Symbiodinium pilosum]